MRVLASTTEHDALRQATEFFARLRDERASAEERAELLAWRRASPLHERVWQRVEQFARRLNEASGSLAVDTLSRAGRSRRRMAQGTLALLVAGSVGWIGQRAAVPGGWGADLRTGTGEQRTLQLADGSLLQLNTGSAVALRFDDTRRHLRLLRGEILIKTAAEARADQRPFSVGTPHGLATALGTRFTVRLDDSATGVAVFAGAVELRPIDGGSSPVIVTAGERGQFDATQAHIVGAADSADAWSRGVLIVNDERLGDVLAELGRYRPGLLRCDPAVAGLRLSAALPVLDIDVALSAIAQTLPVRIERFTRYWVQVTALDGTG